jgi:serine/threonine protein kinase/Tol biopolymer transport system component
MPIAPGTQLGRYEVRSKIGEGGMGEVYLARDPKIGRDVAIKVLPATFSADAERLARFEQEACAAGSLNHPNVLVVYDVGAEDGSPYVVSELLAGETLREKLSGAQLPQRRAIDYAQQIARGLAAAHERGIVHRDLKPENVFITVDGRAKILDFGLAKLTHGEASGAQTEIPTRRVDTDPGAVMGTVGYMAPEQVRGQKVDHRADIFSFGCVLYEMLAGRRAFRGESAMDTLSAILKQDPPDLSESNRNVSPALERLVLHCLEKNPAARFHSASDLAFTLDSLSTASGATTNTPAPTTETDQSVIATHARERRKWLPWIVAALFLVAAVVLAILFATRLSPAQAAARPVRLSLKTPDKAAFPAHVTVSPDGARVVFTADTAEGKRLLWVRPLDALTAQPLAGTDGATAPFWSPDSRYVGYFANGKLYKVDAAGGRPQALCDAASDRGGAWNSDGVILFGGEAGLYRVSAQGGASQLATKIDAKEEAHRWPYFLPDGRHFVFLGDAATTEDHHLRVGSLDSQESQILVSAVSRVAYAPQGYLLYVSQGALVAQPFDAKSLKLAGEPVAVAEHVAAVGNDHEFDFSVSDDGVLAYQSGGLDTQLTWFDRTGNKAGTVGEPGTYDALELAPDGRRAAVMQYDPDGRPADIWLVDLARGAKTRLTFDPHSDSYPLWSPDGNRIAFSSNRRGPSVDLFVKSANGTGEDELLLHTDEEKYPTSWTPDAQSLVFDAWHTNGKSCISLLSLTGERQSRPLLCSDAYSQQGGRLSPDGRLLAYVSNESGRWEVYVQPYPLTGEKWQISSGGGSVPTWRGDGKELYYMAYDEKLMSAEPNARGTFEGVAPRALFQTPVKLTGSGNPYAPARDGSRFLVVAAAEANNPAPMTVVLNWTADLKKN